MRTWNGGIRRACRALHVCTLLAAPPLAVANDAGAENAAPGAVTSISALAATLEVGDVIFIRVSAKPFREVATATGSWTNHVGVVVDTGGTEPLIDESTFPLSRTTSLSRFAACSEQGRIAVARLHVPLDAAQRQAVQDAAARRLGIFYDTGFDLHSRRQFCSRFVREVLREAASITIGEPETFAGLLTRRPHTDLRFWKAWYFGRIPWERETVTPASLLHSPAMQPVFDGIVLRSAMPTLPAMP